MSLPADGQPLEIERPAFPRNSVLRLKPLFLLGSFVLGAQLLGHNGARVQAAGFELPHFCPARAADDSCLGCGTTRASIDLLQGDFGSAWQLQPFVFLLPLIFVIEAFAPALGTRWTRIARYAVAGSVVFAAILPWVF